MKKIFILSVMLFIGSLIFAQTKEYKTYVKDMETPSYGYRDDRIPCVLTMSYYVDDNGNWIYDGPFSVIGKENVSSYEIDFGAGRVDVLYEMHGNFSEGLLDGNYTFTRIYDFKSDKGKAPNKWVKTGHFSKGVPTGVWDYLYTKKTQEASIHVTIQDGKPVGDFYSHGFDIDNVGKNVNGAIVSYETIFRGKSMGEATYYKGINISTNKDIAKKYADGAISIDEVENMGYYVNVSNTCAFDHNNDILKNLFGDFYAIFTNKEFQKKCIDEQYLNYGNWLKITLISVNEKSGQFWSPAKVNTYIENVEKIRTYDDKSGRVPSLIYYTNDLERIYKQHEIKTVHYKKIKAALDKKKLELEKSMVEEIKLSINSKTTEKDLNAYMKSKADIVNMFSDENKALVNSSYETKLYEFEAKKCDDLIANIKSTFDINALNNMKTAYPNNDEYKSFGQENKKRIDEALVKQEYAIDAYATMKQALSIIVVVSQNKKIAKKPIETIENDYKANPSNWEVFKGSSQDLPKRIADFCPMDNYMIKSVDYLSDGSYSYKVVWNKQINKKETKQYVSYLVVLSDKKHVDLNSFDISKAQ